MIRRLFTSFARQTYYPDKLPYLSPAGCGFIGILLAAGSQFGPKAHQFSDKANGLFLMFGLFMILCGFIWCVNIYQMRILEQREMERTGNDWIDLAEETE